MSLDYSFVETFATKVNDPDIFDAVGAPVAGVDQFFAELGKIAKAIQGNTFTAPDAQAAKALLQNFSNGINRINTRIAQVGVAVGNAQDAQFKAFFGQVAANTNLAIQQVTYAADEIAAGNSASVQKFTAAASGILKNVGGFLGLIQIGNEFKENGLTAVGVDKGGEKALGVLAGLAGGEVGALAFGAVAVAFGGTALVAASAAIIGAVGIGYLAGKAGESLWEPFRYVYEQQFLPSVFTAGTTAYNTIATGLSDRKIKLGKFDGTWLEGLTTVSDADKATFSTLMAGVAKVPATTALNADITKLFVADFTGQALAGRDLLLKTILTFAKDNGYATERITVNAGDVNLDLPNISSTALNGLRDYIKTQLSPADQAGWALTGPSRIVVALAAGTHAASAQDSLVIGSDGVDGLIGGAGSDDLIGGKGQDILLGGAGTDNLFGGDDADLLNGGAGGDWLYGGAGNDTYQLTSGELFDVINDSDGNGTITVDGTPLTGGKKVDASYWISDDKQWGYFLTSGGDLIISKGSSPDKITIRDWQTQGGDHLGITLDNTPAVITPLAGALFYNGDQRAPLAGNGNYDWAATSWATDGILTGGVAEANFNDVISSAAAGSNGSVIHGYGGADALSGSSGKDDIYGDDGNDIIGGGAGSDNIRGGAGNDFIVSAETLNIAQRLKPADSWSAPVGATVLAQGSNWGAYTLGGVVFWNRTTPIATDDAPDVVDAGAGNDRVYGGRGDDYIQGGLGLDSLNGGGGNDIIDGGDDADLIFGDGIAANGVASELNDNDFIDGGAGNDSIYGQGGDDEIYGGLGEYIISSAPYSIAFYVCYSKSTARFGRKQRRCKAQKQTVERSMERSNAKTSCAHSVRLAGQKGLGRRMDSAWDSLRAGEQAAEAALKSSPSFAKTEAIQ